MSAWHLVPLVFWKTWSELVFENTAGNVTECSTVFRQTQLALETVNSKWSLWSNAKYVKSQRGNQTSDDVCPCVFIFSGRLTFVEIVHKIFLLIDETPNFFQSDTFCGANLRFTLFIRMLDMFGKAVNRMQAKHQKSSTNPLNNSSFVNTAMTKMKWNLRLFM